MTTNTATKVPAIFRKAAATATEVADRAAELSNSFIDGQTVTAEEVHSLFVQLGQYTKVKSKVDSSTKVILFRAMEHLHMTEMNLLGMAFPDVDLTEQMDQVWVALDQVPDHVNGLFSR